MKQRTTRQSAGASTTSAVIRLLYDYNSDIKDLIVTQETPVGVK